jgi:hypothetical protein
MATKKTTKKNKAVLQEQMDAKIDELSLELNKPSGGWPKITQGSHLTVRTFEDGRTELQWDDAQLQKDVEDAIRSLGK